MANNKLPLRIRIDVRDQFDAQDCALQKTLRSLEEIVGLKVSPKVEWDLLYRSLESSFPDKAAFVPNIAGVLVSWCSTLNERIEDEKYSVWTDGIVEKFQQAGMIKMRVEVSDDNRPTTAWSQDDNTFLICFPRTGMFSPERVSSGFETDFKNLFVKRSPVIPIKHRSSVDLDEDWAKIPQVESAAIASTAKTSVHVRSDRIPAITTLPSLDIWLRKSTPYLMHVVQKGSGKVVEYGSSRMTDLGLNRTIGQGSTSTQVEQGGGKLIVQATHEPSLQFLNQYLQRWIKKDHQDTHKVPLLRLTLSESNFGVGLTHDTLTIEAYDTAQQKRGVEMNPVIVLALIENVLGYQHLPRVSAGLWEYRRDIPFEQ